ncbi:unnamed protein product, partial [marine sediment metagenome]
MKNKWSSCSSRGNVTLSSELIGLPNEVVEYVIVHELLHLIVPNHGVKFSLYELVVMVGNIRGKI